MAAAAVIGCGVKRTRFPGRGEPMTFDVSEAPLAATLVRGELLVSTGLRFLRRPESDVTRRSAGEASDVDMGTVRDASGELDGGSVEAAIKYDLSRLGELKRSSQKYRSYRQSVLNSKRTGADNREHRWV